MTSIEGIKRRVDALAPAALPEDESIKMYISPESMQKIEEMFIAHGIGIGDNYEGKLSPHILKNIGDILARQKPEVKA
jgi:hypothetical protein